MNVIYKFKEKAALVKMQGDCYTVLGYGVRNDRQMYFVANDELRILQFDDTGVVVLDDDLSDYIRKDDLNYGQEFHIQRDLLGYVSDFDHCHRLQIADVWHSSKLANFFLSQNYTIPEHFKKTILNKKYKTALIEGFLMFSDSYINFKNPSGYWDDLIFMQSDDFDSLFHESFKNDKQVTTIEVENFNQDFHAFIRAHLYDKEPNEEKSEALCERLFRLYDSIFMNGVEEVCIVKTFYDECFVMKYEGSYYCLNKSWGS